MSPRNIEPFLNETWSVDGWTDGWSVAEPYVVDGQSFLLLLRTARYTSEGNNVHIYALAADGTLDGKLHACRWAQGVSSVQFYVSEQGPRMLALSSTEYDGQGKNVHIYPVNADGSIGSELVSYRWTQGWTTVRPFVVGNERFLFLLKKEGFGADENNIHIHRLTADGKVGPMAFARRSTQGWSDARFYRCGQRTFLLRLKTVGVASDGSNLRIDEVAVDGDIGVTCDFVLVETGWTGACTFEASGCTYLALVNKQNGAVHIRHLPPNGRLGTIVCAYDRYAQDGIRNKSGPRRWTPGWTVLESFVAGGKVFLFALRAALLVDRMRAKILRVAPMESVGPMVVATRDDLFTIQMTLAGNDDSAYRVVVDGTPIDMVRLPLGPESVGDPYYGVAYAQTSVLAAGASASYQVLRDGTAFADGTLQAAATPGTAPFTIALAGCINLRHGRVQPDWDVLLASEPTPQLLVLTGDNVYANTTLRSMVWAEHLQQRGVDSFAKVMSRVPVIAVWDDHDFGPNNSAGEDADRAYRDETARAFRELFHGTPFAATKPIYCRLRWQDVELFMLDARYHRHQFQHDDADDPKLRRMLGDQQWGWLENAVATSAARFKILVSGSTLDSGSGETWAEGYPTELARLKRLAGKTPGLLVVSGDIHKCTIKSHSLGSGRLLWEVIASGLGRGWSEHSFVTLTVDATSADPTICVRFFRQDGTRRDAEERVIALSTIS